MGCKFLDSGCNSALKNMERDFSLLEKLGDEKDPICHFYDWEEESATYGYFIDPEEFLDLNGVKKMGLELARRPTGGGIVFHNCDLAFSVLMPASSPCFSHNSLENYAFINQKVKKAVERFSGGTLDFLLEEEKPLDGACKSFCMAKPTKYDVMLKGKKVGGAAQRKTKLGYLHQGSILLGLLPEEYFRTVLKPQTRVEEGMKRNSFPLLGEKWTKKDLNEARAQLKALLQQVFNEDI